MAIINIATSEEEARSKGVNVRPCTGHGAEAEKLWLYDTHVGLCLSDRERNMHDDSDWFMLVWNEEKGKPEEICFASTRGWTYPCYGSKPDATMEIKTKYAMYCDRQNAELLRARTEREKMEPRKGKLIRVVRGRKVPVGTTGTCIWRGPGKVFSFAQAKYGAPDRVGLKTESGEVFWTAISNVEVIQELEARAS
jgi:hypothetical protein